MEGQLSNNEVRVLGTLIEKEITTPDYYPLSLNALINACNQKSNRNPVVSLTEDDVREALDELNRKGLAGARSGADSRVTKYAHRAQEAFNFDRRQTALLCELMLRGPQTPGELRSHAERMFRFDDLETLLLTLQRLIDLQPPFVKKLPRTAGTKELRYAQLLAGDNPEWVTATDYDASSARHDEITELRSEVADLKQRMADLQQQFDTFKKQFE